MSNLKNNLQLGNLKLQPISVNELENFKKVMKDSTIAKIKEDVKRNRHNVNLARNNIAYN